jgi:hypothetical protein
MLLFSLHVPIKMNDMNLPSSYVARTTVRNVPSVVPAESALELEPNHDQAIIVHPPSPMLESRPRPGYEGVADRPLPFNGPDNEPDDDADSDYMSFSSSEEEGEEGEAARIAREHERQRVLEAAGLIVKSDRQPPPRPPPLKRNKSSKRARRVPPPAPDRSPVAEAATKELPALPEEPIEPAARLEDAFERYEAFKLSKEANRLSIVSMDALSASPTSPVPLERTASAASTEHAERTRSHTGFFSSFLGRKTPANDEKKPTLVISGPIISGPLSAGAEEPMRNASPAFGSVSLTSFRALRARLMLPVSLGRASSIGTLSKVSLTRNGKDKRPVFFIHLENPASLQPFLGDL